MNRECSESTSVCVCLYKHMCVCGVFSCMCIRESVSRGMGCFSSPRQYLLSILRFEERELVSIFMDVVKHEILAVFPNPVTVCMHKRTLTEKSKRKPC